jgi:hypothetical protein
MNSKKAKRIRQLVRHLQEKDTIQNVDWDMTVTKSALEGNSLFKGQRTLHPQAGKAVYKQMKKRAVHMGKA